MKRQAELALTRGAGCRKIIFARSCSRGNERPCFSQEESKLLPWLVQLAYFTLLIWNPNTSDPTHRAAHHQHVQTLHLNTARHWAMHTNAWFSKYALQISGISRYITQSTFQFFKLLICLKSSFFMYFFVHVVDVLSSVSQYLFHILSPHCYKWLKVNTINRSKAVVRSFYPTDNCKMNNLAFSLHNPSRSLYRIHLDEQFAAGDSHPSSLSVSVCFVCREHLRGEPGSGRPCGGHLPVPSGPHLHLPQWLEPGLHALPDQRLPHGHQRHRLHLQHHRHRHQPLLLHLPQPQIR